MFTSGNAVQAAENLVVEAAVALMDPAGDLPYYTKLAALDHVIKQHVKNESVFAAWTALADAIEGMTAGEEVA